MEDVAVVVARPSSSVSQLPRRSVTLDTRCMITG